MPPAMVSSGTAAAAAAAAVVSPRTAPKQNPPLWNPRSGETLAGIAPFTIPFASEGFWVAADAMDPQSVERGAPPRGNPREPNLEGVFSMLFQSPNVDKAPVASSSGLSRPRMVKVRRHFPLSRVRPGLVVPADFEGVGEQGLNPFLRDPYPAAGFSGQVSFGISCSSSDSVRTEGANFVFGNNSSCFQRDGAVAPASDGLFSSSIDRNTGGFQPGTTEGANFVSAARHTTGTTDSSYLKDCTYRDVGGASSKFETVRGTAGQFTSSNEECIRSTANVFMFGSSSEESATSHRSATRGFDKSAVGKLPEELQTLNIKCSGTADNIRKSEAGDHSLGSRDGGAFVFSSSKNVSGSFGEHNCTQGAFVFGSSSRKNSIPDLSSSGGSDRSSVEKLPDYLRELKIKDSTLKNIPGDTGSANLKFSTTGSHVSEGKMIPDDSTFNSEAIKSHFYVKENVESVLPDEMRKLNIEVPNSVSSLSETQGPCNSSQVDEKKTFMFGCNMGIGSHETSVDKPPEGMETVNSWNITIGQPEDSKDEGIPKSTSGFALRNFYEKSEDPGQRAADGFDESAGGKLPEEIQKLNIRDPENDDTIGKASFGDSILEANSGGFVYASSKSVSDSFSEKDRTEGVFVFGSKPKGFDPDLSASGVSAKSFGSYNTGTFAPESNGNVSGSYGGTSFEECFTSESRTMPGTSCSAGALRHYGELIQLLDQTLDTAEKNSTILSTSDQFKDWDYSRSIPTRAKAWRSYLKSRAYFCLGRLEEALALLKGNEQVEAVTDRSKSDSWALLSVTVSELLRLKVAGNTAFKSGQHSEAVEHYTAALTYNIESRPFAAVCFCNRAAAYQALGQITEAISDCSLAIALDPNYPKAISRRATLHEMIRDYGQAAGDLHRLISFLERKQEDRLGGGRPTVDDPELVRLRLAKVEEKARKEIPLDMYMILGIESSSDAAEIKKAYRKAALRHHPDKASQLLVRSENTDEKLWKEVADEVHRDTDRLFKMIGEAYAVLSDPSKRLQYDTEEEIRTSLKGSGASTTHQQQYHTPGHYERSSSWPPTARRAWANLGHEMISLRASVVMPNLAKKSTSAHQSPLMEYYREKIRATAHEILDSPMTGGETTCDSFLLRDGVTVNMLRSWCTCFLYLICLSE
ncbi:unnamed protein product [Spirodela intermedia]|uniref:J domain-containing protein n=1 Tax=Spirodela intermedia TaxID=51605 RepID=A0A7I8KSI8_SPIIN|nr:unnamed protein product [Spirodela intermedia]